MARKVILNPLSGTFDTISEVTLTAVGSTPNSNGASIANTQALTLQPADGTNPGVITSGTQTIGGDKTFTGNVLSPNLAIKSTGDLNETSFSAANNQAVAANITGLAFSNASVRSFDAIVSVTIDATSDLFEQFTLKGIQRGADWRMSQTSVGDSSGFIFTITNAGQIQYVNNNYSGFSSATVKFRAWVTTV